MKILVIGGVTVGQLLNDFTSITAKDDHIEWAEEAEDALELVEEQEQQGFDLVVISAEDGLANAEELASDVKMASENDPVVIVVRDGVINDGADAGIALGKIDKIVPKMDAELILKAFAEVK